MQPNEIAAYISLFLAILFWLLSTKQASDAKKTLSDIKSEIITWQAKLNEAAINIISSRPEVIAKETAIEEVKSLSVFSSQLTKLIEKASLAPPNEGQNEYQLKLLNQLLDHHKSLILGKQQLMNQAIAYQSGHQPVSPETKTKERNK